MKIGPQTILPSLKQKKQNRLTLKKKQNIIKVPNILINPFLTQNSKQHRKSQSVQLTNSENSKIKSQIEGLDLIFKVQRDIKTLNNRMRSQSQCNFVYQEPSSRGRQQKNLTKQIKENRQNYNSSEQKRQNLRPCHRKLLKNLLVKEDQQSSCYFGTSFFPISQIVKSNKLLNSMIRNDKNQKQKQKQTINLLQIQKLDSKNECQKKYESFGTMTDLSLNNDSYNEFMKFKLSQQDTYLKMKQLFKFMDDLSVHQILKFSQRNQSLIQVCNQKNSTQRQSKITELIQKIGTIQQELISTLLSYFQKVFKIQEDFNFCSQNFLKTVRNQIFKVKETLNSVNSEQILFKESLSLNKQNRISTPNKLKIQLNSKLNQFQKFVNQNYERNIRIQQKLLYQLKKSKQVLLSKFETWKECNDQRNFMTRVCINDLIRLPQMCMVVFGMSKDFNTAEEIEMMRKIGINLDEVPQFQQFYHKSCKPKGPDKVFKQMVNVKCLNCAYFKSKMRMIHKTNCQLEPVLKILNLLVKEQNKKNYDFK